MRAGRHASIIEQDGRRAQFLNDGLVQLSDTGVGAEVRLEGKGGDVVFGAEVLDEGGGG